MNRVTIFFFLSFIFHSSIISQNIFKNKQKINPKKIDKIAEKIKNCNTYEGLFTIYQSKKEYMKVRSRL